MLTRETDGMLRYKQKGMHYLILNGTFLCRFSGVMVLLGKHDLVKGKIGTFYGKSLISHR